MIFNYLNIMKTVPLNFSCYKPFIFDREVIVSVGKSAQYMYECFVSEYPSARKLPAFLVVPEGIKIHNDLKRITIFSSHPQITEQSFAACDKLIDFIKSKNPEKTTVLLSGGSSSLIEKSDTPEKTIQTNKILIQSGKTITEINKVRSDQSLIKNGKLAEMFDNIHWDVFVMSDIPFKNGDNFVGSMPFFRKDLKNTTKFKCADSNTLHDHLLHTIKFNNLISIRNFNGSINELSEIVIGHILSQKKDLLITGEPTLKVKCKNPGIGGRMTHLALTVLPFLSNSGKFYALSSDGIDGNSPFAGAVIENTNIKYSTEDIAKALKHFDSGRFLEKSGMILKTGYTGINLNDFIIFIRS